jgi:hypothetical protein
VDIERDDDDAARDRAELLVDGRDVELIRDGVRNIVEFKTAQVFNDGRLFSRTPGAAAGDGPAGGAYG